MAKMKGVSLQEAKDLVPQIEPIVLPMDFINLQEDKTAQALEDAALLRGLAFECLNLRKSELAKQKEAQGKLEIWESRTKEKRADAWKAFCTQYPGMAAFIYSNAPGAEKKRHEINQRIDTLLISVDREYARFVELKAEVNAIDAWLGSKEALAFKTHFEDARKALEKVGLDFDEIWPSRKAAKGEQIEAEQKMK
jgi:hypothetical protein